MKFKIPIYWTAKVPCWNYCDLSVSLTVTVANVLHYSKLLPGYIVYSSLDINLCPCSEQQLFVRISFIHPQPQSPTFSFYNLYARVYKQHFIWGDQLKSSALWSLWWGRVCASGGVLFKQYRVHSLPPPHMLTSLHVPHMTLAAQEAMAVTCCRINVFLGHHYLQVLPNTCSWAIAAEAKGEDFGLKSNFSPTTREVFPPHFRSQNLVGV